MRTDDEHAARGTIERATATLAASWARFADGTPGARLVRTASVAAAVFPDGPERTIFNNAVLLDHDADAVAAGAEVEARYADAGVDAFAFWVHETAGAATRALVAAGWRRAESTLVMTLDLEALRAPDGPELDLDPAPSAARCFAVNGLPHGLFPALEGCRVLVARQDGRDVATALTVEHEGDCGVYDVATVPAARRQGLAAAVTARALQEARDRGCRTASLQSTAAAERVYARLGFVPIGRFHEWTPPADGGRRRPRRPASSGA
jgi:GNAT superfamily N-acetyltransferase